MFRKIFFVMLVALSVLSARNLVLASDSTIYVDESYDGGDSDGSSEKPFDNIEDAIKEGKSKIHIKDGTYKEKITLDAGMEISGESKSAIISGTVNMKNGSSLSNITVSGSSSTGVVAEKDAKVSISNCEIRSNNGIGVNIVEGNGKLTVKNSKIYSNNQKGFYIQRGNQVEITECSIYGNKGEGIDIRAKVNGTIKNNSIYDNKEGGIEVIVGSSDLSISNNTIKSNSSSGIAAQFYSENKKTGQIKISGNKITKNGHYGISCGTPSGGKPSKGYWMKSLDLKDNNIDNNKGKAIAGSCKIIEAVDEEEEKDNVIVEDPNAKEIAETEAEKEKLKQEEEEKMKQEAVLKEDMEKNIRKEETQQKVVVAYNESNDILKNVSADTENLKKSSRIKKFIFGVNEDDIARINGELVSLDNSIEELGTIRREAEQEEIRAEILTKMEELERQKNELKKTVEENSKKKGIVGWIVGLFN